MGTLHTGDIGAVIWISVTEQHAQLDLTTFLTRTVRLRRPITCELVVITEVPLDTDPLDNVLKLKLLTGTDPALALTGTGGFVLEQAGIWRAEVHLSDGVWSGTTDTFELAHVQPTLAMLPCTPA